MLTDILLSRRKLRKQNEAVEFANAPHKIRVPKNSPEDYLPKRLRKEDEQATYDVDTNPEPTASNKEYGVKPLQRLGKGYKTR